MKKDGKTFGVRDLNREQMTQLKRYYWNDKRIREGKKVTFADFEIIDDLVTDEEIYQAYKNLSFTEDDFIHW